MKKLLLTIILTIILSFVSEQFLPWWIIAVVAGLVGFFLNMGSFKSFVGGFLGIFLLWTAYLYYLNVVVNGALAERLAALFSLPNSIALICLVGIIGGLVGGTAAMTGSLVRKL